MDELEASGKGGEPLVKSNLPRGEPYCSWTVHVYRRWRQGHAQLQFSSGLLSRGRPYFSSRFQFGLWNWDNSALFICKTILRDCMQHASVTSGPLPCPRLLLIVPGKQVELAWPLALSFPEGGSSERTGPLLPLPLPT